MLETMTQPSVRARVLQGVAFTAFFLSGASSLVFQTLWSRLLSHVFGSSSIAISSVVSVFMGGLGLGAYVFGKRAERLRDPLLWYALAETAVGCMALLIPQLLKPDGWLAHINAALRAQLGGASALFLLARFGCIVPVLLVPTTLMGSTLPLLTRHFVSASSGAEGAARMVGRLYAVNTFGAVTGVFASSFVLMPQFGVAVANSVAACTNFALAALIFALRRARLPHDARTPPVERRRTQAPSPAEARLPTPLRRAAALAFAGSGFSSLLYEVVWSRALVNTIGGSLYSFALILTTFLVGIAAGSALLSGLYADRVRPIRLAAVGGSFAALLVYAPWAVHLSSGGAVAIVVATWFAIAAVAVLAERSIERLAMLSDEAVGPHEQSLALRLLFIPCLGALIATLQRADRLSAITLAVVLAICVFLALLLASQGRPFASLIALQVFIAVSTWMSAAFADELSLTFASMVAPLHAELPDRVGTVQAIMFLTAALCVLPSALSMGAVFPASLRVWTGGGREIARDVGVVYAGNTVGSILGAWLPGFVLMPSLGMQQTLYAGIAWNLVTALMLACVALVYGPKSQPRSRRHLTLTAAAVPWLIAIVAFAALRPERLLGWNISKMTLGAFRLSLARDVLDEETWGAPDLVYYRDGLSTTVTVERWGRHLSLKNNGKVDASNGDDMPTQIMVGALPLLLHEPSEHPLDVAIVGFGSGVTVGAALQFPVRSVDVIELERATVDASRYFGDVNHLQYVLDDFPYVREPRLTVIADDGRNYLAATHQHYDVIVSEPSNPWLTGVSDLFTSDHFAIAKRRLKPDGMYCQWAQLYELSPENVKTLYRTFAENFRHVLAFSASGQSSDTILVGSDSPLALDLARIAQRLADPRVRTELGRADVTGPEDIVARVLLASRAEVLEFTAGAPVNTDDNARIELAAPRDLIGFERHKGYLETMYAESWRFGRVANRLRGVGSGATASDRYADLALALLAHGRKAEIPTLLERARQHGSTPRLELASDVYALLTGRAPGPQPNLRDDPTPHTGDERAIQLLQQGFAAIRDQVELDHIATAVAQLETLPVRLRRGAGPGWALFESYVRYRAGDYDGTIELLEELLRQSPEFCRERPELYYYLARAHEAEQQFGLAVRNMRTYVSGRAAATPASAEASGPATAPSTP